MTKPMGDLEELQARLKSTWMGGSPFIRLFHHQPKSSHLIEAGFCLRDKSFNLFPAFTSRGILDAGVRIHIGGLTWRMAILTLSGVRPPARMIGRFESCTNLSLIAQSCVFPVPPDASLMGSYVSVIKPSTNEDI